MIAAHVTNDGIEIEIPVTYVRLTTDDDSHRMVMTAPRVLEAAKKMFAAAESSIRGADPDELVQRVTTHLMETAGRALNGRSEPGRTRRRAVSDVLRRLADLVMSMTIRRFAVDWDCYENPSAMRVTFETAARTQLITIPLVGK